MNNPEARPQGISNKYNKVIARNEVMKQSRKKRLPRYARNDNGKPWQDHREL